MAFFCQISLIFIDIVFFLLSYFKIPMSNSSNSYIIIHIMCLYFQILISLRVCLLHLSSLPTIIYFLLFLDFGLSAHGIFSMPARHKLRVFVSLPIHSRCSQSKTTLISGLGIYWIQKIVHMYLGPSLCVIISGTAHSHKCFPQWPGRGSFISLSNSTLVCSFKNRFMATALRRLHLHKGSRSPTWRRSLLQTTSQSFTSNF